MSEKNKNKIQPLVREGDGEHRTWLEDMQRYFRVWAWQMKTNVRYLYLQLEEPSDHISHGMSFKIL